MKIFKTKIELRQWRKTLSNQSVGFVPTMGALHGGHLSLVRASKKECDKTIVSIFVNKLQFAPNEDFDQYPRTLDSDLGALKTLEVDVVFLPTTQEMYHEEFSVVVNELKISQKLEGASRPEFFSGVTTVVSKLFNLVHPSHAFFGKKDIQQLVIIKNMVHDLNYNIKVVGCETVREKSGLAISSRNQYLDAQQKKCAAIIYQTLQLGENMVLGDKKYSTIIKAMREKIEDVKGLKIDYLSIAATDFFDELSDDDDLGYIGFGDMNVAAAVVISCAVYINKVRLIDNIIVYHDDGSWKKLSENIGSLGNS